MPVGMLINRSAYAATGINLETDREGLKGTVGLVIRVKGDGLPYAITLTSGEAVGALLQPPNCCTTSALNTVKSSREANQIWMLIK